MKLYSQRDPAYGSEKLGPSKLTVHGYGCFLVSMATLYQVPPEELLKVQGAFTAQGYLNSHVLAKYCGGAALPAIKNDGKNKAPDGWCIAVTDHYTVAGIPTHFFPYNAKTGERIDPLDFPCAPEANAYRITEFRPFSNIKLDLSKPVPVPLYPDVPAGSALEDDLELCKDRGIIMGFPDGMFRPEQALTRAQAGIIGARMLRYIDQKFSTQK